MRCKPGPDIPNCDEKPLKTNHLSRYIDLLYVVRPSDCVVTASRLMGGGVIKLPP
jgi:hypothetical protein